MKKKLKTFLFALMSIISLNALAYDSEYDVAINSDGAILYFSIDWENKQATLLACEMEEEGEVSIPSDVMLPDFSYYGFSVAHISSNTFKDCTNLTSISIPGSVKTISRGAFDGCTGLTSVHLEGDATFDGNIFSSCINLTTITSSNSNKYDSRNNCNALINSANNTLLIGCKNTVIPNTVTSIGSSAFSGCTGLTSIEIPNSVTTIGDNAFSGCTGLTSIEIPNSVTSIGSYAFSGSGLTSATVNCPSVGYWLSDISSLKTVTLGESVTSVSNSAFSYCTNLTNIIVDDNNTTYDSRDNCNAVIETATNTLIRGCKNTVIPNTVTGIGSSAFSNSGLTSIIIPNSVININTAAFRSCAELSTLTVNVGNAVYDSRDNCNAIIETATNTLVIGCNTSTIPNTVTTIGSESFYGCTSLASIDIPNSVTSIDSYAFYGCTGLTEVTIGSGLTEIANNSFLNCSNLTSIQVDNSNTVFDSRKNCNAIIETASNTLILACSNTIIPSSVRTIGERAFYNLSKLTSLTIPNSVTSIGSYAFYGCSNLTTIIFDNCCPTFSSDALVYSFGSRLLKITGLYYPAYAYTYYTTNEQTNVFPLYPQIKINSEWSTYCATASFDVPDGIEAYVVENYEDGIATLKSVTTINEGEGLLLKPTEIGTFYDVNVNASPEGYETNLLVGVTDATVLSKTSGDYTNYILANGVNGIGFYAVQDGSTLAAGKAYLPLPTASLPATMQAKGIQFVVNNEDKPAGTPVIEYVNTEETEAIYNMNGQRVTNPTKGIYIKGGRKFIIM